MRAYNPSKKQLPSWMMMNETKHWFTSSDVDLEIVGSDNGFTQKDIDDGMSSREKLLLNTRCVDKNNWILGDAPDQTDSRACDLIAFKYPEVNAKHRGCYTAIHQTHGGPITSDMAQQCDMFSYISGKTFPEYEKCLKPNGMDDPDCQRTCYVQPNQPGCEVLTAGLTPAERSQKIRDIGRGPDPREPLPPPPPLEETVVVAASMRSVTPTSINCAYMDPLTKKAVVVKKTLVDLYKPTDKVSVVLNKKTNKFVGISQKTTSVAPPAPAPKPPAPKPPVPPVTRVVAGIVVKVLSANQVQIKYTKPDGKLIIMTTVKNAHNMKLNEAINVNLNSAAPYAFVSIVKKAAAPPAATRAVAGTVVKVIDTNNVQIKYTKPDGKLIIMTTIKNAHNMKLNEAINVNLGNAAPYAFISIAKK